MSQLSHFSNNFQLTFFQVSVGLNHVQNSDFLHVREVRSSVLGKSICSREVQSLVHRTLSPKVRQIFPNLIQSTDFWGGSFFSLVPISILDLLSSEFSRLDPTLTVQN